MADPAAPPPAPDTAAPPPAPDTAALTEEIRRLRQRVDDLESVVGEYRVQMNRMLTSASWRVTRPLREAMATYRGNRARLRRQVRRLRGEQVGLVDHPAVTGLFPPTRASLPEGAMVRLREHAGDPPAWGDPPQRTAQVLVLAHVHYPELWSDIEDRLVRIPHAYDLVVSVTTGHAEAVIPTIRRRHPTARIVVRDNLGRDWGPLSDLVREGVCRGYAAVAKVHTKKSEHRIDGDGWRLALLDGMFESREHVRRIVELLTDDRTVGLIVPGGFIEGTEHWGCGQGVVEALAARLPMAFDPAQLRFPGGSMFWCRPWLLEQIARLEVTAEDFEREAGQYDGTTAHALERIIGVLCTEAGMAIIETTEVRARLNALRRTPPQRPRVLAFYLPQYHRTPENDAFWGEGFTDWDNVTAATPLFTGHRQPILPAAEVGTYDLADPGVLHRQAALARAYGVAGFIVHHYWFDGRRVLDTPLRLWQADATLDLPLALCWANEPWTRRWDGKEHDVLIPQTYREGWVERFWHDISGVLADPRYLRIDGRPLLIVYRLDLLPEPSAALTRWRALARDAGLGGVFIVGVQSLRNFGLSSAGHLSGVDAILEFPPLSGARLHPITEGLPSGSRAAAEQVLGYREARPDPRPDPRLPAGVPLLRGVMPGWDNTARRGERAYLFHGANPVTFAGHVRAAVAAADRRLPGLLCVNAWNEWAEGAAIEPGARFGRGYLEALVDALGEDPPGFSKPG